MALDRARSRRIDDLPGWVRDALCVWGREKYRLWLGGYTYRDPSGTDRLHIDGYMTASLLAKIRAERDGAGQGGLRTQHWPELYSEIGLEVQRCLPGAPERPWLALHLQYVFGRLIPPLQRIGLLDTGRTEYFQVLRRGETWVHARLEAGSSEPAEDVINDEISRLLKLSEASGRATRCGATENMLQSASSAGKLPAHSGKNPELSFAALRRPTLSRRQR